MKLVNRVLVCVIGIVVFSFSVPSFAQTPITVDSTTLSELTSASPQISFTVDLIADQPISIQITAINQELALQAVVFGANNTLVLAIGNPDNLNTITDEFTPTSSGTYTIQVTSSNAEFGEFVLRLSPQTTEDICETYVFDALEATGEACESIGRNQACLGNLNVSVVPAVNTPLRFDMLGDIVNITDIESFQLSPLNIETNEWGVALLNVQADIPDTLPGQNVTMLLFGDVSIENSAVSDQSLQTDFRPMQAFYFSTGIGIQECNAVADSGILIQTPEIDARITFVVNEVVIELGSTAFLSFSDEQTLDIDLLEGSALVSVENQSALVATGQRVSIPVDNNLLPVAPPNPPIEIPSDEPPPPALERVQPEAPTATSAPSTQTTPTLTPIIGRPPLPTSGTCVLRAFDEDNNPNVRSLPTTDAPIVSFIVADETYPVIGQNLAGTWYEISTGWIAGFVTERGGDCSNVPVTYIPPTATPLPTLTPIATAQPIAGNNNYSVTIDAEILGLQHSLSGNISSPQGVMQDSVTYSIINSQSPQAGSNLSYSIACTGTGVEHALIFFSDGSVRDCSPTASNFLDMGFNQLSQIISIGFDETVQDAYVTWSMTFTVQR